MLLSWNKIVSGGLSGIYKADKLLSRDSGVTVFLIFHLLQQLDKSLFARMQLVQIDSSMSYAASS